MRLTDPKVVQSGSELSSLTTTQARRHSRHASLALWGPRAGATRCPDLLQQAAQLGAEQLFDTMPAEVVVVEVKHPGDVHDPAIPTGIDQVGIELDGLLVREARLGSRSNVITGFVQAPQALRANETAATSDRNIANRPRFRLANQAASNGNTKSNCSSTASDQVGSSGMRCPRPAMQSSVRQKSMFAKNSDCATPTSPVPADPSEAAAGSRPPV